jgi:hypothetical protein
MARRTTKMAAVTGVADHTDPRTQEEILVAKKGKLVISLTPEERLQFLQWTRDFSGSRVLGPPGVRAVYYYLRDKPWSFIVPDYEKENPDGTKKLVQWGRWVKENLIDARKLWLAGDRGPWALDPDLLDDDGDSDIVEWSLDDDVDAWAQSIPELDLDPWVGQPKRVLVLCEKAGMKAIVDSACLHTRTGSMCCGGDASMKQKSNVGKWAATWKDDDIEPVILYAGDHDMQGVNMDVTWARDVAEVDSVIRVAITLEQARERGLPMESARDKMHEGANISSAQKGQNKKIQEYIDAYGEDMVELNALVADSEIVLRDIIRDAIAEHIDHVIWGERKEEIREPTERVTALIDELQSQVSEDDE